MAVATARVLPRAVFVAVRLTEDGPAGARRQLVTHRARATFGALP